MRLRFWLKQIFLINLISVCLELVPKSLKQEFQRGVAAWMGAMYKHHRSAFNGKSYWSISPATQKATQTKGGLAVGLENDGDYFDPLTARILEKIWKLHFLEKILASI